LSHEFRIQWPDCLERRTSTLLVYGEVDGYSAMAKTVGLPVAITALMILDGEVKQRGVLGPFLPEIYLPVMEKLKAEGIQFGKQFFRGDTYRKMIDFEERQTETLCCCY